MSQDFLPLNIAVLTASDTRTLEEDTSGQLLSERLTEAGHQLAAREIVPDNIYLIRALVSQWIADESIDIVISTGGTGLTGRDGTPEAVEVLFEKKIQGFGELFRQLSYEEIATSTIQSRVTAGVANGTYIFCLPGSSGACRMAWDRILAAQLDLRSKPCNFAELIPRLRER
ncbi:MAG: molybdenum cofactor biosynthesis protein B [SAR324 cluster bacterium]|nr:molybdenum cofactor biosynthesis protein B [SAR324 cluster bacterium]